MILLKRTFDGDISSLRYVFLRVLEFVKRTLILNFMSFFTDIWYYKP